MDLESSTQTSWGKQNYLQNDALCKKSEFRVLESEKLKEIGEKMLSDLVYLCLCNTVI